MGALPPYGELAVSVADPRLGGAAHHVSDGALRLILYEDQVHDGRSFLLDTVSTFYGHAGLAIHWTELHPMSLASSRSARGSFRGSTCAEGFPLNQIRDSPQSWWLAAVACPAVVRFGVSQPWGPVQGLCGPWEPRRPHAPLCCPLWGQGRPGAQVGREPPLRQAEDAGRGHQGSVLVQGDVA